MDALTHWKSYLEKLPTEGRFRPVILASWQRSQQAGIDPQPHQVHFRKVAGDDFQRRFEVSGDLLAAAKPHLEWASFFVQVPHVVYLTDGDGIVLFSVGDAVLIERFRLGPGYDRSERAMGTNGAGTALAAKQPVAVVGPEHFEHSLRDCTCVAAPIRDSDGTIIGAIDISTSVADGSPERVLLAAHIAFVIERELAMRQQVYSDERRRSEAQSVREAEFQMALEAGRMGTWTWDFLTGHVTWSPNLEEIHGLSRGEFGGTFDAYLKDVHPEDREIVTQKIARSVEQQTELQTEYRIVWPDGTVRWIEGRGRVVPHVTGTPVQMAGVCTDISERKRVEAERERLFERIVAAREQLHHLSIRLMRAQEEERRHLARELHDQIGQALTALIMQLECLPPLSEASPFGVQVKEALAVARGILRQVRELSLELRPPLLDEFGLEDALESYLDRLGQKAGFVFQFRRGVGQLPLSREVQAACFRVAQEALTNVARHANAKEVRVDLGRTAAELELVVSDNGVGFEVVPVRLQALKGHSLGLLGMEERVHILGGQLDIDSAPGSGTVVRARFSLSAASSEIASVNPEWDSR